ncbi:MAG: hypothetical protein NT088_02880 [Candidatus Omnitrophica bacterium]|nr:hypothetical protein [Candidatus Omnitrophota bacterium]
MEDYLIAYNYFIQSTTGAGFSQTVHQDIGNEASAEVAIGNFADAVKNRRYILSRATAHVVGYVEKQNNNRL